jgi:hypothetical protein
MIRKIYNYAGSFINGNKINYDDDNYGFDIRNNEQSKNNINNKIYTDNIPLLHFKTINELVQFAENNIISESDINIIKLKTLNSYQFKNFLKTNNIVDNGQYNQLHMKIDRCTVIKQCFIYYAIEIHGGTKIRHLSLVSPIYTLQQHHTTISEIGSYFGFRNILDCVSYSSNLSLPSRMDFMEEYHQYDSNVDINYNYNINIEQHNNIQNENNYL